jgi:hypothetical protein
MIADTAMRLFYLLSNRRATDAAHSLRGEDSNPDTRDQNPLSCQLNDPGRTRSDATGVGSGAWPGSVAGVMGSLIKKRRKRMRKKKHKKMLRRTRHQRRK